MSLACIFLRIIKSLRLLGTSACPQLSNFCLTELSNFSVNKAAAQCSVESYFKSHPQVLDQWKKSFYIQMELSLLPWKCQLPLVILLCVFVKIWLHLLHMPTCGRYHLDSPPAPFSPNFLQGKQNRISQPVPVTCSSLYHFLGTLRFCDLSFTWGTPKWNTAHKSS